MAEPTSKGGKSENRIGFIDMIAHDAKADEAVLVINEPHPWDG